MISILLATFNGEKFLSDQINSLLSQSISDFVIYINDDCSTDKTYEIAIEYANQYPEKIFVSRSEKPSGSAKYNFISLMINNKSDYVMLCDQDDVWLPDKIEKTLKLMHKMENCYGKTMPILIHTDLIVVDENLKTVSPSYRLISKSNYGRTQLKHQLIQNTLTGCTAMYNRELSNLITKKPEFMVMHDWWLMLIAATFGKIETLNEQTVLYRQHKFNEIGAKDVRTIKYKVHRLLHFSELKISINNTYLQAQYFFLMYKDELSLEQIKLLNDYCKIPNLNKFNKLKSVFKLGTFKCSLLRNIAYLILV